MSRKLCSQGPRLRNECSSLLASGSPLHFFLEPVAVSLNYLGTKSAADGFPEYKDFSMMGFSGGGWTTVVYAAIDARIRLSIQVAGSVPLYLRPDRAPGDPEQTVVSFYRMVGYPDLYVLDAYGRGRKHVQILNRRDSCCFGEKQHKELNAGVSYDEAVRTYESQVSHTLAKLAAGTFRVEIDETSSRHMISEHAIEIALSGTRQWGRQEAGGPGNAIAQAADGGERS